MMNETDSSRIISYRCPVGRFADPWKLPLSYLQKRDPLSLDQIIGRSSLRSVATLRETPLYGSDAPDYP
jgi:hypothetical protein